MIIDSISQSDPLFLTCFLQLYRTGHEESLLTVGVGSISILPVAGNCNVYSSPNTADTHHYVIHTNIIVWFFSPDSIGPYLCPDKPGQSGNWCINQDELMVYGAITLVFPSQIVKLDEKTHNQTSHRPQWKIPQRNHRVETMAPLLNLKVVANGGSSGCQPGMRDLIGLVNISGFNFWF